MRPVLAAFLFVSTPLFAGTLHHRAGGDHHQLLLRRDGARLVIADAITKRTLISAPAATTDRVTVDGAPGEDDTLAIDLTQPIVLPGGIAYDGGVAGWDTLVLTGGTAVEQRVTQLTPHDGVIDVDGLVIRYSNLEPITDTAAAASYTIVGTAGGDSVTVSDGPGGTTIISSPSFESVTFANKTNVVFDGLGGGDSVLFNNPNPATGLVSLIVTNVGIVTQSAPVHYSSLGVNATSLVDLQNNSNDADRVEITTQNGHVLFFDANDLTVGGVSPTLAGVRAVQTGSVSVQALGGSLTLDDGDAAEVIKSGDLSGDVGLNAAGATSELTVTVNRFAAVAPAGSVSIQAIGNLLLGTGGATFANDVRAANDVNLTVLGAMTVGGLTTITSDAFGGNSGGNVVAFLNDLTQTEAGRFVAAGTAGGFVQLWTGTGSFALLGTGMAVQSTSGDVSLLARGLTIAPTSGITAATEVEIIGHGLELGAVVDLPDAPMELSDAELDRIFAPVVIVHHNPTFGAALNVSQPITFTTGAELILRSPTYVTNSGAGSISAPALTFEVAHFSPMTWTITPTSVQGSPGTALPYSGVTTLTARGRFISTLWLPGPSIEDTFFVTPSATTTMNIDGYLPAPPTTPGDVLDFDLTGVVNPVLTVTLTPDGYEGSVTAANRQPVNFQAIETLVDAPVNLGITKTNGVTAVIAGTAVTFTITVSNPAPIPVAGATVTDTFPPELGGVQWSCAPSSGSSCAASGNGDLNDTVTIAANGSVTYTVTSTLASSAAGTLSNTASVTTPGGYVETDPMDNMATDADPIIAQADLRLTKTASRPAADPLEVSYAITLRNAGPSDAQNVSMTDVLPANTVFSSLIAPAGYSCTTPAAGQPGAVTCTRATLPPSATADGFTLTVRLANPPAGATISNTVTATSATTDPTPTNAATAAVAVAPVIPTLSEVMIAMLGVLLVAVALRKLC